MSTIQEQEKEIIKYLEKNPVKLEYGYRDMLSKEQILTILNKTDGIVEIESEIYENNIEYIYSIEKQLIEEVKDVFDLEEDLFDIIDFFYPYICTDINIKALLNNSTNIDCLAIVYSNYDCATSYQEIADKESYLGAIWERVKHGCSQADYLNEHANDYTSSVLCFAFQTDILDFAELKRGFKTSITIPKGTQYGFFSSFHGSGSLFAARTIQDMTLPKTEPEQSRYDCIELIADIEQSYSIEDVYGRMDFDYQNIKVT